MKASVVVPTFNRRDVVCRTVNTLISQEFPQDDYEIVVVVDGSEDGTGEALRAIQSRCTLRVVEQENRGQASARNAGMRAAVGEVVILVDDDMICSPQLVREHVRGHEQFPNAVCFGALFLSEDSPRSLAAKCFEIEFAAFHDQNRGKIGMSVPPEAWVVSNTSAKLIDIARTGGFDEQFRMREDAEFCLRLKRAGLDFRYVPRAVAHQYYTKTCERLLVEEAACARWDAELVRKHPEYYEFSRFAMHAAGSNGKRSVRNLLVRFPKLSKALLRSIWRSGELGLVPEPLAVKALQWHRALVWSRSARDHLPAVNRDLTDAGISS